MQEIFALTYQDPLPLHHKLRPKTLEDYLGHTQYKEHNKLFELILKSPLIPPLFLVGPPGIGKTSFARLLAKKKNYRYVEFNAIHKDFDLIHKGIEEADLWFEKHGKRTIFFLDEIDRVSRENLRLFLPYLKKGSALTLIAATPRHPDKVLDPEMRDRFSIIVMGRHTEGDLREILDRALKDKELGYGKRKITMDDATKNLLCKASRGNARDMLRHLARAVSFAMLHPQALSATHGIIIDRAVLAKAFRPKKKSPTGP